MALSDLANASYEKRQQRIMQVRRWLDDQEAVTVAAVREKTGYAESTIIKPIDNNKSIVIIRVKSIGLFTKLEKVLFFFLAI